MSVPPLASSWSWDGPQGLCCTALIPGSLIVSCNLCVSLRVVYLYVSCIVSWGAQTLGQIWLWMWPWEFLDRISTCICKWSKTAWMNLILSVEDPSGGKGTSLARLSSVGTLVIFLPLASDWITASFWVLSLLADQNSQHQLSSSCSMSHVNSWDLPVSVILSSKSLHSYILPVGSLPILVRFLGIFAVSEVFLLRFIYYY